MVTRRDAREWALQLLFQLDLNPQDPNEGFYARFWEQIEAPPGERRFAEGLVAGVHENLARIDETIQAVAENWQLRRMAVVDRNVLRLAVYEMLMRTDIPPVVSINEAVDLAKYFSNAAAGRFVNGLLDRVRKDLHRPARTASGA